MERIVKAPGADHPITVEAAGARIRVRHGGEAIADSEGALVLREAGYPPVYYLPRDDVRMERLERSDHATWCPYKGEAAYFSIRSGHDRVENAVWSYETPHAAVRAIGHYLAFYPAKVEAIEAEPR
jgi:uncharacterized protein (DUF427 family)